MIKLTETIVEGPASRRASFLFIKVTRVLLKNNIYSVIKTPLEGISLILGN